MKKQYIQQEPFEKRISEKLREHREKLNLRQLDVANSLHKARSTYQCWETTGKRLTNVHDLLKAFQVLGFSTTEVIDVLGLPPLKLSEIESIYQDEETLKSIKDDSICLCMRNNCKDMPDFTIERLLDTLFAERLKRHRHNGRG